jgi:hypothetical protein
MSSIDKSMTSRSNLLSVRINQIITGLIALGLTPSFPPSYSTKGDFEVTLLSPRQIRRPPLLRRSSGRR